jgi:type I restriction enzyme M protein
MTTSNTNINEKANLIWAIADKLTGSYKPHEYGEVILPLTVIRRFDCVLEDTKNAVLEKNKNLNIEVKDPILRKASGHSFYNTSPFTFKRLLDDPDNIETNFRSYLNGFSENVRNIIERFKFDNQIITMVEKNLLYICIFRFHSAKSSGNIRPNIPLVSGQGFR